MTIDTTYFRATYKVDEEGKYAHYKKGKCEVCGNTTTQCDASLIYDGLVTYLCSDKCHDEYWISLSH